MQRVATGHAPQRRLLARAAAPILTCALGASLLLAPLANAQDATPAASPEASPVAETSAQAPAEVTSLFTYDLAAFPTAPVSVRLLRMTLQPGASSPMHTHPGVEFDLVESGTLTVNSEGEADVSRGGGDPTTAALTEETLGPGDLVVFPAGIGMNLVNASDEPLVLLSAVFHPVNEDVPSTVYTDGDPAADAFEGVSFQVLGDGIMQSFPEGAATITLDQVVVPAGTDLPDASGAALYSLVDGDFGFSAQGGDVQVSRTASPGLRPNAAPEQEFTLAVGDAAFFPAGVTAAARSDQPSELSLLELTAVPAEALASDPATIAFLPPTAEAETEGETEFTEIAVGAPVVTTTGSVNVRTEPSIEAEVVEQVDEGVALTVIGGPEDVGDFTWWQVSIDDTEGPLEGWVATDFIALANAPEATEEPAATEAPATEEPGASGTPVASPEASPVASAYAEGDIVVTNSENVRIRAEATIDGEPVDAFPLGTELEITGAPEEADDYTWYPVTLVEDETISGWVVADFIEPADDDEES
jgi:quercetin dioxygenase-like cupin family protein/uncharacterized protein YgiM (DUF1202 family)